MRRIDVALILAVMVGCITTVCVANYRAIHHPGYLMTSRYGTMYCRDYQVTHCGVHASECTDERNYKCLQDVTVKVAE